MCMGGSTEYTQSICGTSEDKCECLFPLEFGMGLHKISSNDI